VQFIGGIRVIHSLPTRRSADIYPDAERIDAGEATVIPGLIDAHAHLMGLGYALMQADLVGASDKTEVVARLKAFEEKEKLPDGRSEEHTSELQSREKLVCSLLL